MNNTIPKAIKVEPTTNQLVITFDNGETKYLKTHYIKTLQETFENDSSKFNKMRSIFTSQGNAVIGGNSELVNISEDGTVTMKTNSVGAKEGVIEKYTPEELWNDSRDHMYEL